MVLNTLDNEHNFKIVLIGPENSGKSALINALFGKNISLVSNIGGTTKMPVKKYWGKIKIGKSKKNPEFANISFVDLGGLYTSKGDKKSPVLVGKIFEETYNEIENSDLIIHVIDGTEGLLKNFEKLHHLLKFRYEKPIIVVISKCDLISDNNKIDYLKKNVENRLNNSIVLTSTITYIGISELLNIIINILKNK